MNNSKRYDTTKQWYAIHTYSGYEEKVAESIRQRADSLDMKDKIFAVLVPKEKMIEIKNGNSNSRCWSSSDPRFAFGKHSFARIFKHDGSRGSGKDQVDRTIVVVVSSH